MNKHENTNYIGFCFVFLFVFISINCVITKECKNLLDVQYNHKHLEPFPYY